MTWRRCRLLAPIGTLLLPCAGLCQGPPTLRYDWRTQSLTGPSRVVAGKDLRFSLNDLNSTCFTYRVTVTLHKAREDISPFRQVLGGTPTKPPPITKLEEPVTASLQKLSETAGAARVRVTGFSFGQGVTTSTVALDTAARALTRARVTLVKWKSVLAESANRRDALAAAECDARSGRGRAGAATSNVADALRDASDSLRVLEARFRESVRVAAAQQNDPMMRGAGVSREFAPRAATRLAGIEADAAALASLAPQDLAAKTDSAARMLSRTSAFLEPASAGPTSLIRDIHVDGDADSVTIVVVATERPEFAQDKPRALTDTIHVAAARRFRLFASVGWMVSLLDDNHYQRETRRSGASGDTGTVSTFVNTSASDAVVTSPIALVSMTLWGTRDAASLAVTSGAMVRTVNGKSLPEFLVGLSGAIRDRFLLTVGFHVGRKEKLLLGDPDAIATENIPSTVSQESAVGSEWSEALAAALSIAVP